MDKANETKNAKKKYILVRLISKNINKIYNDLKIMS
jgi:hypothetical protein